MRVALLLESNGAGGEISPEHSTLALNDRLPAARAVPLALGIPETAGPSTLVLRCHSYESWPAEASSELESAFAQATCQAEDAKPWPE